jgi:hypothetical protein
MGSGVHEEFPEDRVKPFAEPSPFAARNRERPMHHRITLIILAGQSREIEPAVVAASSESVGRVALWCFHTKK